MPSIWAPKRQIRMLKPCNKPVESPEGNIPKNIESFWSPWSFIFNAPMNGGNVFLDQDTIDQLNRGQEQFQREILGEFQFNDEINVNGLINFGSTPVQHNASSGQDNANDDIVYYNSDGLVISMDTGNAPQLDQSSTSGNVNFRPTPSSSVSGHYL